MSFLKTVPEDEADGDVAELYETDRSRMGYLPNYTRLFSLHPEAFKAWRGLGAAIAKPMDLRRFELATVAAARRLRSSYCSLAHGKVLVDRFYEPSVVERFMADPGEAALDEVDLAVVRLAEKVADDASSVTEEDVVRLRELGLSDRDILDIVLTAAARCFFSKVLDATGTLPDREYRDQLGSQLVEALTVGRPIEA